MEYIKKHCTGNSRYKSGQKITPVGIVLHSIGCPQPNADVLWKYWQGNSSPYMTHYVLDDEKIYECANDNLRCWHVCSPGNNKWIGIEMCEPKTIKYTSGASFKVTNRTAAREYCKKTYQNAVWLIARLCKKYGWDPYKAVLTHHEVTTKKLSNTDHIDPQHLWDGLGLDYNLAKLRKDVAAAMKDTSSVPSTSVDEEKKTNSSTKPADKTFVPYVVRVTSKSGLNVRKSPNTDSKIVNALPYLGAYTIVEEKDGWGLLKAYQKNRNGWICLKYTKKV